MKTMKQIFSIALIALASTAFSQRAYYSEEHKAEIINMSYSMENSRIANKVSNFLDKFSRQEEKLYLEPVVCMTFWMDQPDVVYEAPYYTESWMTTPFSGSVPEADLKIEAWMSNPFNCNVAEADLPIELWMITPFEAVESIKVESWMTSAWN
jgi:hypothetical protein